MQQLAKIPNFASIQNQPPGIVAITLTTARDGQDGSANQFKNKRSPALREVAAGITLATLT